MLLHGQHHLPLAPLGYSSSSEEESGCLAHLMTQHHPHNPFKTNNTMPARLYRRGPIMQKNRSRATHPLSRSILTATNPPFAENPSVLTSITR